MMKANTCSKKVITFQGNTFVARFHWIWHATYDMVLVWHDIHIYNKKKKKTYKFEEVKISRGEFKSGFSSWVEEHLKIKRDFWKKFKSSFSIIVRFIYIKNVYRDDKLEGIERVKQEEKRIKRWFKFPIFTYK